MHSSRLWELRAEVGVAALRQAGGLCGGRAASGLRTSPAFV